MKKAAMFLVAVLCIGVLAGCGGGSSSASYADGTYTGTSSVFVNDDGTDDGNGYGVVTITIEDGVITACEFQTFEEDGTLKDDDYGSDSSNRDYYSKAQKAVAAVDEYASMLVEYGSIDDIDAISGATVNYDSFCEAVEDALTQAAEAAQ